MATDHFVTIINQSLEICIYSEGSFSYDAVMGLPADELPYILQNLRSHWDDKQKSRQEFIKTIMEFASKSIESLFKLLKNLGQSRG
jgi:uncharacterized UPF0160 family protein